MRIFLDANILFSAAKSDGAVRQLIRLLHSAGHSCCVDDYVIAEAARNLAVKAPHRTAELERLLGAMERAPALASPSRLEWEEHLPLPQKDRPVLAAAIRNRCNALVTGDRSHFGMLWGKSVRGVAIHSPASLAKSLGF